ncbi:MAG: hypothetical protein IAF58_17085 [Leptolyngbya sp.]|nr:hypothetical protein [Candidatus Melainabacteria bacterium]
MFGNSLAKASLSLLALPFCVIFLSSCGGGDPVASGKKHLEEKQYEAALGDFNRAIEKDPNQYYAYFGIAYAYANTNRQPLAINFANKALTLNPQDDGSYFVRG